MTWSVVLTAFDSLPLSEIADIEINPFNSNEIFISPSLGEGPTPLIYSNNGGMSFRYIQWV